MKDNTICPVCGEGHLTEKVIQIPRTHNGKKGIVPLHISLCSECGSETATENQVLLNKRLMNKFRKECDGLATGREVKEIRKFYDITQKQASKIFGGGLSAFSKYENDDICQSDSMDVLLKVCSALPEAFLYAASLAKVDLKKDLISKKTVIEVSSPSWITAEVRGAKVQIGARRSAPVYEQQHTVSVVSQFKPKRNLRFEAEAR